MFVINGRFLTQKPTGVHRYAFEICNHLHELGVDFYVAIPKKINKDYKINFKTVECGSLNTHLWEQIDLPRFLNKNGSPLLLSLSGSGPLVYSNQIITIHDVSHERHPEWFSRSYVKFYHFMLPRIGNKAHAILTVSQFSKQEIIETLCIPENKIHVVYGDVPIHDKFYEEKLHKENRKKENASENYILSVSSMDPRKNFQRLVEAFNKIEDKSIKLYIVGMSFKAFNTPDLKKLSGKNVILTGYVDDEKLQDLYKNALFSVYPSLYEGFGMPPLESMTYGCPVINSDIPALREIGEDAALYVNPLDVDALTITMNKLVDNEILRDSLKQKGFRQIKQYSWDKSAKQILDIIKQYS